jgi:CubicO group peptidase (beta-lactamase class C family)
MLCAAWNARGEDLEALKARITAAAKYSVEQGGEALIVKVSGKTIWETYAGDGGKYVPQRIYSGTKAYWGLAALVAVEDGILKLDEKVEDTITEWQGNKTKSQITVRELLDFSSGLPALPGLHENEYPDRTAAALKAGSLTSAGRSFIYGPAALQVFHEVLARKLKAKKQSPTRFLERQVLSPLGLGSQRYLPDGHGVPLLASGFMQTARQWSAMGRVMLEKGEPVLDEDEGLLAEVLKGSKANAAFAFGFWNNHARDQDHEVDVETMLDRKWSSQSWRGACLSKAAPGDLIACIGSYGQRLYAVPSRKLMIVRLGKKAQFKDAVFLKKIFAPS